MFGTFLGLLLIAVLLSSFLFYRYAFSIQHISVGTQASQTSFQEQTLLDILTELDARSVRFEAVDTKEYTDIFTPPPITPSEE